MSGEPLVIPGQVLASRVLSQAAEAPVHAYLFIGPPGTAKRSAARQFAARLLGGGPRDQRLALAGEHPDVREIERVGAAISAEQAEEVIRLASLAPIEGNRKVLILDEFHLLRAEAAARLLKTIEEPAASTVFIVIADDVPPELVTIASRCVRVEFTRFDDATLVRLLVGGGVAPDRAQAAVAQANGNLDRAQLLALDESAEARRDAFAKVIDRIDGTGAVVADAVAGLLELIDAAAAPLAARHAAELQVLEERIARFGERGAGRKATEERHKRELRRHRTDELRAGLSVMAGAYRNRLVERPSTADRRIIGAIDELHRTLETLERNPNETLQLQALLLKLPIL
jgi:DNA polymerase III subunit delta'